MTQILEQKSIYQIKIVSLQTENTDCLENFLVNIKNESIVKKPVTLDFNLVTLFKDNDINSFELSSIDNSIAPIEITPKINESKNLHHKYSNIERSKYSRYHFKDITIDNIYSDYSIYYISAILSNGKSVKLVKIEITCQGKIQQEIPYDNVIGKTKVIQKYIPNKKAFLEIKIIPKEAKLLQLMSSSEIEETIQLIYKNIVKKGDIVIDGGAHVGLHTFPLSSLCGADGNVHAFEVIPNKVELLKSKIKDNKFNNVILHTKALSKKSGISHEFHHVVEKPGLSGLIKDNHKVRDSDEIEVIQVQTITIDDILPQEKVKFIKLDIEGAELFALQGASRILKRSDCMVIFENGRDKTAEVYGYNKHDFFDFFDQINYQLFDLFGNKFKQDLWTSRDRYIPWYFIAVPKGSYLENFVNNQLPNLLDFYLMKQEI